MKPIYVLYQSDDNYAQHMGVSIESCLRNNAESDEICVVVIDDNISELNKRRIEEVVSKYGRKLIWIDANVIRNDTLFSKWPSYSSFRKNTNCYLKYFIFDGLLDPSIERIMYIDSDSIVSGSIQDLFEIDMQGKAMGMTRCCLVTKEYREAIGFGCSDNYYNAGMNLFDSRAWSERKYPERLVAKANDGRMYSTVDQDILNFTVRGDVLDLGCKFNFQCMHLAYPHPLYSRVYKPFMYYSDEEVADATQDPRICHFLRFLGQNPWNEKSLHPNAKMYEEYRAHTPWRDEIPKPSKNATFIFKMERMMYRILPKSLFLRVFKRSHNKYLIKSDAKAKEASSHHE